MIWNISIKKSTQISLFLLFITIKNYVYLVPYVEDETTLFLKAIIHSRKMNKRYSKAVNNGKS